jgi:AcrR family transcriptional regulator
MRGGTNREDGDGSRRRGDAEQKLCAAVLRVAGREGFGNTTVHLILEDAETSRDSFYQHFGSLGECFQFAYERRAQGLCEAMLAAGRESDEWAKGLRQALRVLLAFVAEQPHTAKSLIIEGGRPGSPGAKTQNLVLKRLAHALDSARRQPESRHSAPPLTGDLMVGAITNTLQGLLVKGESSRAPDLLGDYTYLVTLAYFDEETAYREMGFADDEA